MWLHNLQVDFVPSWQGQVAVARSVRANYNLDNAKRKDRGRMIALKQKGIRDDSRKHLENKAHLVRRLVKLEYNDGQSMIEHLKTFKGHVNQLSMIEMKIDDELQALLLLSSLPESWDTLVVTLSNSAPYGKLTTDIVLDSLMNEDARRKE
ncbi:hypothetical protein V6N13_140545 [Hibiscus sabdariffa]